MPGELTAALVAASVSLVVAGATAALTVATTRATLRRDHERQQAELRRKMTDRLYERRVAVYPEFFAATGPFRRSKMAAAADLREHLRAAVTVMDDLHAGEVGLLLSKQSHRSMLELRYLAREIAEAPQDPADPAAARHQVWQLKNKLRTALRADLGLLFDEESETQSAWVAPGQLKS